jgi:serine/threonine protein kinase
VDQANNHINTYYGTPTYMAPEMAAKTPHNPQLADRWSSGVLLFVMLNGHCPFQASTQKELFGKIAKGEYSYVREVAPLAKDLISRFLTKTPEERISPKEALDHQWLAKG